MAHRTDAGRTRSRFLIFFVALLAGCATVAKRDPARTDASPPAAAKSMAPAPVVLDSKPVPARLPDLPHTETLAIASPPRTPDGVRPATHQAPEPSGRPDASPTTDADAPRRLYRSAVEAYARQPSYIARLKRREWVNGKPRPEETLIFKFREQPWSVHFKWLGDEGQGREVLYVRGRNDDKMHILTAANDIPFTPAGRRMAIAPDSFLVKSSSKYPITEAGIGRVIERFGRVLEAVDRKQPGAGVRYLGPTQRPEFPTPLEGFECRLPENHAPEVPQGGKRLVFFDPATKFPVVSATYDLAGQEVDYACFDRFQLDVRLDDDDFNPDKLWGKRP